MRTLPTRGQFQMFLQRYRRPVAAGLAALATLLALSVLRAPQQDSAAIEEATGLRQPVAGQVAVPVLLADQAIAAIAEAGDLIDIIAAPKDASASAEEQPVVVARRARVIEAGQPGSGLMPMASGILVVAVDEPTALALARAAAYASLSIAVHPNP